MNFKIRFTIQQYCKMQLMERDAVGPLGHLYVMQCTFDLFINGYIVALVITVWRQISHLFRMAKPVNAQPEIRCLFLLLCFFGLRGEKSNARQLPLNLHNLMSA